MQRPGQLDAVHARHFHIAEDGVGMEGGGFLQALPGGGLAADDLHPVLLPGDLPFELFNRHRFVVDQVNRINHGMTAFLSEVGKDLGACEIVHTHYKAK